MRYFPWLLTVAAGLQISCSSPANVSAERSELTALDRQWSQDARDIDKFLSYYAPDATIYPQGLPMATGSEAIRDTIAKMASRPGFSIWWNPAKVDVSSSGDLGYTSGLYVIARKDTSGAPITEQGEYLTVWKRQPDGHWKAEENIFSGDVTLAPREQQ